MTKTLYYTHVRVRACACCAYTCLPWVHCSLNHTRPFPRITNLAHTLHNSPQSLKWMLQGKTDEIRSLQSSSTCRSSAPPLPLIDPTPPDTDAEHASDSDGDTTLPPAGLLALTPDKALCFGLLGASIPAVPSNAFPPDHPDHEAQCINDIRKADKHIAALHLRHIMHSNADTTFPGSQSCAAATPTGSTSSDSSRNSNNSRGSKSSSYLIVVTLLAMQMCWALRIIDVEISWIW